MVKNPPAIPGPGRSPGGGHGNPLQCSCRESPTDRGAWWAAVHGVAQCSVTITTSQLQNTFSALKENPIHLRQSLPALPQPSLARVPAMQSTPCLCGCPLWKLLIRGIKLQKHIEQGSPHMGPCRERSPSLQPCITGGKTRVDTYILMMKDTFHLGMSPLALRKEGRWQGLQPVRNSSSSPINWFKMTLTSFPLKYSPLVSSGCSSALPKHSFAHTELLFALRLTRQCVAFCVALSTLQRVSGPDCIVCTPAVCLSIPLWMDTFRLLPAIGNCEQCCCEHVCMCMIMHVHKHACMCVCESLGIYLELEFLCS